MFNRPGPTRAVFERIAAIRPRRLFIIADGPRPDRPDDALNCEASRSVIDRVDWDCDLQTDLAEHNVGCDRFIASRLDCIFSQVERLIILEDDCVPDLSFFRFCAELLERYEDNPRVRTISGNNFLLGKRRSRWSYHYSNIHNTWGWATWRRSWQKVDMAMRQWPQLRDDGWLVDMVGEQAARFWLPRLERTYEGEVDAWDYQYYLSCWLDQSLAITPNQNLVRNIGIGKTATHTIDPNPYMNRPEETMQFPLVHPPFMVCDQVSDQETLKQRLWEEDISWPRKIVRRMYYVLTNRRDTAAVKLVRGRLADRLEAGEAAGGD
jgi:hypothetical protein